MQPLYHLPGTAERRVIAVEMSGPPACIHALRDIGFPKTHPQGPAHCPKMSQVGVACHRVAQVPLIHFKYVYMIDTKVFPTFEISENKIL